MLPNITLNLKRVRRLRSTLFILCLRKTLPPHLPKMDINLFISRLTVQRLRNSYYNMSVLPIVCVIIGECCCILFHVSESISVVFLTVVVVQQILDYFEDRKGNPFLRLGYLTNDFSTARNGNTAFISKFSRISWLGFDTVFV